MLRLNILTVIDISHIYATDTYVMNYCKLQINYLLPTKTTTAQDSQEFCNFIYKSMSYQLYQYIFRIG